MTLPANIRVNTSAPFPATVKGSGPVTLSRQNGIWTIGLQIANIGQMPGGTNLANVLVLLWNTVNLTFQQASVASLFGTAASIIPTTHVNAAGNYNALTTDILILINADVPQVLLPASATHGGARLAVKALAGATAGADNIEIVPNGAETIDGQANLTISSNYGFTPWLYPIAGGWVTGP